MSEIYVAYWSGTGNTQAMAEAVAKGVTAAGGTAKLVSLEDITPADLANESAYALGCPAMGAEELEETVVEPFIAELESNCSGRKIALFGSYDWGDGEWMRTWTARMQEAGAFIVNDEGLIANNTPDDDALAACEELGKALV